MATQAKAVGHYVNRKDGKVYYEKAGSGEPVVLLHGNGTSGWGWRHVVPLLSKHFTCYVVDSPGYDRSDIPPHKYTVDDFTDALIDVFDHAKLAQANLIGTHTGALIAYNTAARFPQRVKKMLMDGMPTWSSEEGKVVFEKWFKPRMNAQGLLPNPSVEEELQKNPNANREELERAHAIRTHSREWMAMSEEAATQYDVPSKMHLVKAPMMVMYGEGDALRRKEQRLLDGVKGSVLKVVQGAPGTVYHTKPEEFVRIAVEYLLG